MNHINVFLRSTTELTENDFQDFTSICAREPSKESVDGMVVGGGDLTIFVTQENWTQVAKLARMLLDASRRLQEAADARVLS